MLECVRVGGRGEHGSLEKGLHLLLVLKKDTRIERLQGIRMVAEGIRMVAERIRIYCISTPREIIRSEFLQTSPLVITIKPSSQHEVWNEKPSKRERCG